MATIQSINSGYVEGFLEVLDQLDRSLEAHKCNNPDISTRIRKLRLEIVDVKFEAERLYDQIADQETIDERRDMALRVEAQLPVIDMVAFTNGILRGHS